MECRADMLGSTAVAATFFKTFYYMLPRGSSRRGDVMDVICDAVGAGEGIYGYTRGPIWVHISRLILVWHHKPYQSARVSKHFVSI